MKRSLCFFLSFALVLSLCSCGGKNSSTDTSETTQKDDLTRPEEDGDSGISSIGDVDVDSGLFNVTITVPADFLDEGVTQDQLDQQAKDRGFKSVTLNDDGSATYVMTKAQHRELMDDIRQSINSGLDELVGSEDYPSIVSIEANDDYTKYKIVVNTEEVGLAEGFIVLGLYIFSGMYHVFNGTDPGNINIQYVNETTGQVIQEANSNDMG